MTFRVKLRIKSVKPHYPVKPAPVSVFPNIREVTDPDLLRRLYEAAKKKGPVDDVPWTVRYGHGNLPYHGPNTCFLWNGIDPINRSAH